MCHLGGNLGSSRFRGYTAVCNEEYLIKEKFLNYQLYSHETDLIRKLFHASHEIPTRKLNCMRSSTNSDIMTFDLRGYEPYKNFWNITFSHRTSSFSCVHSSPSGLWENGQAWELSLISSHNWQGACILLTLYRFLVKWKFCDQSKFFENVKAKWTKYWWHN